MMSCATSRPSASSAPYPKMRSAAGLNVTTRPRASIVTTASRDDASIASSRAASSRASTPLAIAVERYAVSDRVTNVRVVIAEDQPLLRDGIASLLEASGFDVIARCENAGQLLLKVRSYEPDVAIVDIRMPPTFTDEGLRAAAEIRATLPRTGVLVLSQHVEPEHAARLVTDDAGGVGYLLKDRVRDGDTFIDAVRRVATGGTAFDPQVIAALVAGRGHTAGERLTERELQVLSLM